jgi:hypothetical protein
MLFPLILLLFLFFFFFSYSSDWIHFSDGLPGPIWIYVFNNLQCMDMIIAISS